MTSSFSRSPSRASDRVRRSSAPCGCHEAIAYLAGLIDEGKLKYDETVVAGLENAPGALNQMFEGVNTGKLLIKVAEPR